MKILKGIVLFCAVLMLTGCSTINLTSKWADQYITIDGIDDEWQSSAFYLKDNNILLGVRNDNDFIYLALITSENKNISQIISSGLTLWFDDEGGSNKKIGIKFPLGMEVPGRMQFKQGDTDEHFNPEEMFLKSATEMELIIGDTDPVRMSISEAKGIDAKIKHFNDKFIYEFKIALNKNANNSIFVTPVEKNIIGIGIESLQPKMKVNVKPIDESMPDGEGKSGRQRPEGGMPPGGGPGIGMKPGEKFSTSTAIDYWFKVTLAEKKG